jgi:voltage-gated potassium channel
MTQSDTNRERWELLREVEALLDRPMIALSIVWIGLMVLDVTTGLPAALDALGYAIWALFGLHFLIGVVVAPSKTAYLRENWLTAVALLLPAFRVLRLLRAFRVLRAARAARSLTLVRLITSLNRGMRAINRTVGRRGVGYVVSLTALVTVGGAGGMAHFESPASLHEAGFADLAAAGGGLSGYGEALWWTTMVMTTMGSEYWPKTAEGRLLSVLLALYAFAVFGYITATIASLFVGQDVAARVASGDPGDAAALRAEVAALRAQVASLGELLAARPPERPRS